MQPRSNEQGTKTSLASNKAILCWKWFRNVSG